MCRALVVVLSMLLLCGGAAMAQETSAEAAAVVAPWWVEIGGTVISWLWKLLASLLFGYLMKKAHDNAAMQEAIGSLEAGVQDAWIRFVKDLKKGVADGKWDEEEKANAREWALNTAKDLAKGAGRRMLVGWSQPYVDSLISKIVERRKVDKTGN